MISVLCMCYNSEKYLKQIIESWRVLGSVHVFVDSKTNDRTVAILNSMKVEYEMFTFVDFATSRNNILSKFTSGYRIFIDDSYLFIGDSSKFKRELLRCGKSVISVRITKDGEWFSYSKITRGRDVFYLGSVHEFINKPCEYQMTSGYIRELTCPEHLIRTLKRIPRDVDEMLTVWYNNPMNYRVIYYLCRSLLFFKMHGQHVDKRFVEACLIRLITIPGQYKYKQWGYENLKRLRAH